MRILDIKDKLSKKYPFIEIDFDQEVLILKNIISSKRFDMGYAWDLYLHIKHEQISKKVFKIRTFDNIRANFSKEVKPTDEVENEAEKILDLLQLKENLL